MVANLTTRLGQLTSTPAGGPYVGQNRIINGNMATDQYLAGGTIVPSATGVLNYLIDRFAYISTQGSKMTFGQNYGAVTPPVAFSNYLGAKVTTTATVAAGDTFYLMQRIVLLIFLASKEGILLKRFRVDFFIFTSFSQLIITWRVSSVF